MASDAGFVTYVQEQLQDAGDIFIRKMFEEYAVYLDHKVVALICDNQLFVKPTEAGRTLLGEVCEKPPYPNAKPHFLTEEQLDDRKLITALIQNTAQALPEPKPKKPRRKRRK